MSLHEYGDYVNVFSGYTKHWELWQEKSNFLLPLFLIEEGESELEKVDPKKWCTWREGYRFVLVTSMIAELGRTTPWVAQHSSVSATPANHLWTPFWQHPKPVKRKKSSISDVTGNYVGATQFHQIWVSQVMRVGWSGWDAHINLLLLVITFAFFQNIASFGALMMVMENAVQRISLRVNLSWVFNHEP